MGIRYYAYRVPVELAEIATQSPREFLRHHPAIDIWEPEAERQQILELDKCWWRLQWLFAPPGSAPRPAYELVRGQVTHTYDGWIPFLRYLPITDVRAIAEDLADAQASDRFVRDGVAAHFADRFDDEIGYIQSYFDEATRFTAEVANAGERLVYRIG